MHEPARLGLRIRITAALTTFELNGAEPARAELAAVIKEAGLLGMADVVALGKVQLGAIDARCGHWASALVQLDGSLPLLDALPPADQCSVRITRGLVNLTLFHLDDAERDLEIACAIAKVHQLADHEFKATHNLGSLAVIAGDLPRALRLMSQADAMATSVGRDRALMDRAEALVDAGLVDEARLVLTQALQVARHDGHLIDEGDILLILSRCALLDDDPAAARDFVQAAVACFGSRQATGRLGAADLLAATIDVSAGVDVWRALEVASRRAGTRIRTSEDVEACLVRAEAQLLLSHPEKCRTELQRLPPTLLGRLPQRLHECTVRAGLAHAQGDAAAFDAAAVTASRLLAGAQGTAQSLEMRAALAQHVRRLAALDLARAVDSGHPERVYATVERWRAASSRASALLPIQDRESRRLVRELRWLRRQSGVETGEPGGDATQERIAELEARVTRRALENDSAAGTTAEIATVDTVIGLLRPDAGLLEFAETGGRVYAVVITPDGASLACLGATQELQAAVEVLKRDLAASAAAYANQPMRAALRRAVGSAGYRVGSLLLEPLREQIGNLERLVMAPNVQLSALAWHAIAQVEHRPLLVASSATDWARRTRSTEQGGLPTVAALAGPGLPRAAAEICDVLDLWNVPAKSPPSGAAARADEAAQALGNNDIVHIAAHGAHQEESPLFSSLTMADGPLFAHELMGGVGAQHVVLSACDVGRGRVRVGEEALGFTAALLAYGVRCVVSAVAPVPDDVSSTAALVYHQGLRSGLDAADALARAVSTTPGADAFCAFGGHFAVETRTLTE